MSEKIKSALDQFILKYCSVADEQGGLQTEYDSDWPSECIKYLPEKEDLVTWKPIKQSQNNNFESMSNALELSIPQEFEVLFTRYWSEHLNAVSDQGKLTLLQVWNQDDFERLQQNLIGHVLMKRRLKQPETLFFAVTDQEDFIISLEHQSGHIVVEQVGKKPHLKLADSLIEFLNMLTPDV